MKQTVIIAYGAGNVYSVARTVERLGCPVVCSNDAEVIRRAGRVILPGVGQAASAMRQLHARRLDTLIPRLEVPVLGICLGMQLMCLHSEEGNTPGLGIFPARAELFDNAPKVPHTGWNTLSALTSPLFRNVDEGARVYFVHSYRVPACANTSALCDYGGLFSAALGKENFWGCQFHPEKSAEVGEQIIRNFLAM